MVKGHKGNTTQIEEQPGGQGASEQDCPDWTVTVAMAEAEALQVEDEVAAQLRDGRVRLECKGQVVAWVDDEETVRNVTKCREAGGRYQGRVSGKGTDGVVILFEGSR
ncbi:MAG: hypothetical protein F4Y54_06960 [Dehalococcoidia bacterium]|nr:hypothetical protein [Dehalococcoidia bacterium]